MSQTRQKKKEGLGGFLLMWNRAFKANKQILMKTPWNVLGVTMTLSNEMSFVVFAVFRQPTTLNVFFVHSSAILETYDGKEVLVMGDFNLNWLDRARGKRLTRRLTKPSQTLLDLIFTNKADRITRTYNLITGLSVYNLTLAASKLTKTQYRNQNKMEKNHLFHS